jgi:hypothetical protein
MSGRISIANADGSYVSSDSTPLELYAPDVGTAIDRTCGTFGLEDFAVCPDRYVCGALDTKFEKCLQAIDCKMHRDMYSATTPDHHNLVAVFSEQMIPHHTNAVNMVRLLLTVAAEEGLEIDADLKGILYGIINSQNFQIHQFRNYLGSLPFCFYSVSGKPCSAKHARKLLFGASSMEECVCK